MKDEGRWNEGETRETMDEGRGTIDEIESRPSSERSDLLSSFGRDHHPNLTKGVSHGSEK